MTPVLWLALSHLLRVVLRTAWKIELGEHRSEGNGGTARKSREVVDFTTRIPCFIMGTIILLPSAVVILRAASSQGEASMECYYQFPKIENMTLCHSAQQCKR